MTYFHIFSYFISQDSKKVISSCCNTIAFHAFLSKKKYSLKSTNYFPQEIPYTFPVLSVLYAFLDIFLGEHWIFSPFFLSFLVLFVPFVVVLVPILSFFVSLFP